MSLGSLAVSLILLLQFTSVLGSSIGRASSRLLCLVRVSSYDHSSPHSLTQLDKSESETPHALIGSLYDSTFLHVSEVCCGSSLTMENLHI